MATLNTVPQRSGEIVRALITVGALGEWFNPAASLGSASGDLVVDTGLEIGYIRITRNANGDFLTLRRPAGATTGDMSAAFGATGTHRDLFIHLGRDLDTGETEGDQFTSFQISAELLTTGANWVAFGPFGSSSDYTTFLDGVAVGDTVNFVIGTNTLSAPAAVGNLAAVAGNAQVVLTWDDPSDTAITKYQYRQSEDGGTSWNPDWTDIAGSGAATTTATIGSLANGTAYTFQVRAVRGTANGPDGSSVSATPSAPATAPAAPSTPTVIAGSATTINVIWQAPNANGSPITSYDIQYRTGSGAWNLIENVTGTGRTISGLTPSTTYEVQVRATNAIGDSDWSPSGTSTTDTNTAPTVVIDQAAQTLQTGGTLSLSVTISDPEGGPHQIAWSAGAGSFSNAAASPTTYTAPSTAQSVTVSVLVTDQYGGTGMASVILTIAAAITINTVPQRTGEVVRALITAGGSHEWYNSSTNVGSVTGDLELESNLSLDQIRWWTDTRNLFFNRFGTGNFGNYFGSGNPGAGKHIYIAVFGQASIADIDIDSNIANNNGQAAVAALRMRSLSSAIGTILDGVASGIAINVVISDTVLMGLPGAPANVNAAAAGSTSVSVTWDPPTSDGGATITEYHVRVRIGEPEGAWDDLGQVGDGDARSHTIPNLSASTEYDVEVAAVNSSGQGVWSQTATVTTPAAPMAPGVPTSVAAQSLGRTSIRLAWAAPVTDGGAVITAYHVQYRVTGAAAFTDLGSVGNVTSHDLTSLTPGTEYELQVSAENSVGQGSWSASVTVTTDAANTPPTIMVTANPTTVDGGGAVTLSAVATDADSDPIEYTWSAPHGSFNATNMAGAVWTAPAGGSDDVEIEITCSVADGQGGTASASVTVTVRQAPPGEFTPVGVTRVRPVDTVEIDWDDDGYHHANADVTADLISYFVRMGVDALTGRGDFVTVAAFGRVVLANESHRYSAESGDGLGATQLRRPHNCRLTAAAAVGREVESATSWSVSGNLSDAEFDVPSANQSFTYLAGTVSVLEFRVYASKTVLRVSGHDDHPRIPAGASLRVQSTSGAPAVDETLEFADVVAVQAGAVGVLDYEWAAQDLTSVDGRSVTLTIAVPQEEAPVMESRLLLWQGRAEPPSVSLQQRQGLTATVDLNGHLDRAFQADFDYLTLDSTQTTNDIIDGVYAVDGVAASEFGNEVVQVNVGSISYQGTLRVFLEDLSHFIAGFVFETFDGYLLFKSYHSVLGNAPELVIESNEYSIDRPSYLSTDVAALTKVEAPLVARGLVTGDEQAIGTIAGGIGVADGELEYTLEAPQEYGAVWVAPAANAVTGATVRVIDSSNPRRIVVGITNTSGSDITFSLPIRGQPYIAGTEQRETYQATAAIEDGLTGVIEFPEWYRSPTDFSLAEQWILARARPPHITQARFLRWQKTYEIGANVDALVPGRIVEFHIQQPDGVALSHKVLILNAELERATSRSVPTRLVTAITLTDTSVVGGDPDATALWDAGHWDVANWQ